MIDRYLSREELQRLISALLVVLGFISLAVLFGFIVVPGMRFQAHTTQESPVVAVQGDAGWLDPTDYPQQAKQTIPPVDPKTVMTPNPELMERGRKVYAQTCATCHGADGKGNGPGAKGLNPVPRDFTIGTGWKVGTRLEEIFRTLDEGVKGSSMVSYSYLNKRDRMALAHVVQSMGAFDHGVSEPKALGALEKLFASAGEIIPNQIPVRSAVDRLVNESQAVPEIQNTDNGLLIKEAIVDSSRAARTLAGVSGWKNDDQVLAKGVIAGLPANGFALVVARYSPQQWKELRTALTSEMRPR